MKVQKTQVLSIFCSTDDNSRYCFPFFELIKTVKVPELIFLLQKIIKFYCLNITFPVENGNSKQEKIGSIK